MKNISSFALKILSLYFLITVSACTKGEVGPKGDPGPAGSTNIVSTSYQVPSWTNGADYWYADLSVEALTSTVQSSGAVIVYVSTDQGKNWLALPYTALNSTNYFMQFVTSSGNVEVQWLYNGIGNGSSPNSFYGTTCQFKVIVIPSEKIKPNVDYNNFDQVKSSYNISFES